MPTNNPDLYLILHKVRGEPAFDIAHQIEMEGEECWIIGTSGHRAYPISAWKLCHLKYMNQAEVQDWDGDEYPFEMDAANAIGWPDLPDHYPSKSSPDEPKLNVKTFLTSLGLPTKPHAAMSGKLTRRI